MCLEDPHIYDRDDRSWWCEGDSVCDATSARWNAIHQRSGHGPKQTSHQSTLHKGGEAGGNRNGEDDCGCGDNSGRRC